MERRHLLELSLVILLGPGCAVDRILHPGGDGGEGGGGEAVGGDEGEDGEGGGALEGGGGSGGNLEGGDGEPGGNFPEPATTLCGELPEGVTAISELASAYAVTGPRADDMSGPPEALRIRLSSAGIEADEPLPLEWDETMCEPIDFWGFAFDIPVEFQTVGVHSVADLSPAFSEHFEVLLTSECGEGGEAGGPGDAPFAESGVLELFVVTDTCVVGELRDVEGSFTPVVPSGGFVAVRSELACVPMWHDIDC